MNTVVEQDGGVAAPNAQGSSDAGPVGGRRASSSKKKTLTSEFSVFSCCGSLFVNLSYFQLCHISKFRLKESIVIV